MIRHVDSNGFYQTRQEIDHFKEIWTVFSDSSHFELLRQACNDIRSQEDIDVSIYTERPQPVPGDIDVAVHLRRGSDSFLVDARFLLNTTDAELFIPRRKSDILFYEDEGQLESIRPLYNSRASRVEEFEQIEKVTFPASMSGYVDFLQQLKVAVHRLHSRKIFLCHASEDQQFTIRLANELASAGMAVWYSGWAINVGDSIVEKINNGIKNSAFMGVILSHHSVDKPWCKREMNAALQRQLAAKGIQILPIVIEECEIPPLLSDILWADFITSFEDGFASLVRSMRIRR